jgi:hypothetical protein
LLWLGNARFVLTVCLAATQKQADAGLKADTETII